MQGFDAARDAYVKSWSDWQQSLLPPERPSQHKRDMYRISAAVIRTHEAKQFPGGIIASLAIPWGFAHGDGDLGYHLVWPRDMIETVGGLLAIQKHEDARRVLFYFKVTQEADGHWPQNMWVDGVHPGRHSARRDGVRHSPGGNGAAREGPGGTRTDRPLADGAPGGELSCPQWAGHATGPLGGGSWLFRLHDGRGVPALLVAANLADRCGEKEMGTYLRETADAWNDAIEGLIYVTGTDLARSAGVDGYYVRFARPDQMSAPTPRARLRGPEEPCPRDRAPRLWPTSSARTPCASFASAFAPRTIRGSRTPCASLMSV